MPFLGHFFFANRFFCGKISYAKAEKREYTRDGGFRSDTKIFLFGSSHHPDFLTLNLCVWQKTGICQMNICKKSIS